MRPTFLRPTFLRPTIVSALILCAAALPSGLSAGTIVDFSSGGPVEIPGDHTYYSESGYDFDTWGEMIGDTLGQRPDWSVDTGAFAWSNGSGTPDFGKGLYITRADAGDFSVRSFDYWLDTSDRVLRLSVNGDYTWFTGVAGWNHGTFNGPLSWVAEFTLLTLTGRGEDVNSGSVMLDNLHLSTAVPEPGTLALVGLATGAALAWRRRRAA